MLFCVDAGVGSLLSTKTWDFISSAEVCEAEVSTGPGSAYADLAAECFSEWLVPSARLNVAAPWTL